MSTKHDWTREELILALDLYFETDYGQMHGRNPKIKELSSLLREYARQQKIPINDRFRSVNSVALKLANFKKLDQNFSGKGMRDGAGMDKVIWKEFYRHRNKLKKEAGLIRKKLQKNPAIKNHLALQESRVLSEDKLLLEKYHKHRESDPILNKRKIEITLAAHGVLQCEACNLDFFSVYGELGKEIVELHFIRDFSSLLDASELTAEDLSIVCGNCHKVLDKNLNVISLQDLKRIIRS